MFLVLKLLKYVFFRLWTLLYVTQTKKIVLILLRPCSSTLRQSSGSFRCQKLYLENFWSFGENSKKKKTFYIASNFRHPSVLAVATNGFPGIFRIFSTVSYSYLRVILENSKPSQMLACVRGVFKFQSNIYDRAFLQNQWTAKSRSLFLEKKLKCLLFKVKFPGQHLLIKINGNSRTMSEIASKLIKTQHNKVKTWDIRKTLMLLLSCFYHQLWLDYYTSVRVLGDLCILDSQLGERLV